MGRFTHLATTPERGPADIFRWKILKRDKACGNKVLDTPAPRRDNDGKLLRELPASITWIGHASFVLKLSGLYVATDPIWSHRIQGVVPRLVAPGVPFEAMPALDVVTLSHNHFDHLDLPTLKRIGAKTLFVVPLGTKELLLRAGLPRVVELDWWQTHREGALEITLVPARHWSMRAPWNRNDMLWGGYVLHGSEGTAYHAGDTALFDGFREIGERLGPIDWAMLPIGAYEPRWFMEPQHMNPDDAFEAFQALGAKHFIAMHWGTFKLTDEPTGEPPTILRALWTKHQLQETDLWVMDVGETRGLSRSVRGSL